jgi:hypothetical protein
MTEQFQRVEPTPFEAPAPAAAADTGAQPRRGVPLLAAIGVLVLGALFVFLLLPGMVARDDTAGTAPALPASTASSSRGGGAAGDSSAAADSGAAPYADAAAARARAAAQEVLNQLLEVREHLDERGAAQWAPDALAGIIAEAEAGDTLYRERDFEFALARYDAALARALALEESIPARYDEVRNAGLRAIEALDEAAAAAAAQTARLLDPDAGTLAGLEARAATLPDVAAAVGAARDAEARGATAAAVEAMERAASLDSEHEMVAAELARLREALTTENFNTAMTDGYRALEAGDFARAQEQFQRADALRPGAPEAAAALAELQTARTAATLRALKQRAEDLLAEEQWEPLIDVLEEALAIDGSLRFARESLATAKERAELDRQLTAILEAPQRLVDDAVLAEAERTLATARATGDAGPRLREQIAAVEDTLAVASRPVPVTLTSDGESSVVVYRVADLGQFTQEFLSLRPGQYTAVASRRGYRDQRVTFTVTPEGLEAPVHVACSETIL